MPEQVLTRRFKVALVVGILAALSFFVAALVTFLREGDWPAKYVSLGAGILAAMFIARRRRIRRAQQ